MSFYYQSGESLNLLSRNGVTQQTGGTIDTNFPASNICDGRPSNYTRYSTPAANELMVFDLNLCLGGDGESAAQVANWGTSGTLTGKTVTQYGTGPYTGTYSPRVQASSGTGSAFMSRNFRFRAGEKMRLYHALKKTTGVSANVYVQDLDTSNYLQSNGTWSATGNPAATTTSASWVDGYITFTMEGLESGGGYWHTVQVLVGGTASGTAYDSGGEVKIVPGWDTVALLGHTNSAWNPFQLGYQALSGNNPLDAYGSDTAVTDWIKTPATNLQPFPTAEYSQAAIWNKAAATRYERWVRFYFSTTNVPTVSAAGELILCQAETLPRGAGLNVTDSYDSTGQVRYETGAGDVWVYNRTPVPRRKIGLRYETADSSLPGPSSDEATIRRFYFERTHGGRYPVLVLPYGTHDSTAVIYGHVGNVFSSEHAGGEGKRSLEVEVTALPIPGLHPGLSSS